MKTNFLSQSAFFTPRLLLALALCAAGASLALFSLGASSPGERAGAGAKIGSVSLAPNSAAPGIPRSGFTLPAAATAASWVIDSSANTIQGRLDSVSCVSASDCWAVGGSQILHYNGSGWAIVSSPNPIGSQGTTLSSVTCLSASDCWAVGYSSDGTADHTLIEHYNGSGWSIVSSPNSIASLSNYLFSVTCVSASDCWAVGYSNAVSFYPTLIEHWDGSAWAIVSSPNPIGGIQNFLFSVSCVSASDCWAAGYSSSGGAAYQTLIEHYNGSGWAIVSSPNTSIIQDNLVTGVACVNATDCWAVGRYNAGSVYQTLIEHYNGSAWAIVSSPNTSVSQSNDLISVTCVSAGDCWAVGYSDDGNNPHTLIEHYNGSAWAIVSSPDARLNNALVGVSCISATDCWAVGYSSFAPPAPAYTLIEHYTTITPTPTPTPTPTVSPTPTGDPCTPPGITVVTDPTGDQIAPAGSNQDIQKVSIAEPNLGTGVNKLIITLKMTSLSGPLPPNGHWNVYFDAPDAKTYWVDMETDATSAVTFKYGTTDTKTGTDTTLGDVDAGTKADDGTITLTISNSKVGNPAAGQQLKNVNGFVYNIVGPLLVYWDFTSNGTYTLVGNASCAAGSVPLIVSRKTHGSAGTFDVDLPLTGNPGIECRSGGAAGNHQIIFTFANAVSVNGTPDKARVTSGIGTVSNVTVNGAEVTVDLTQVANAQKITLTLFSVSDGTNTGDVSVSMGVLLGDVNGSGHVDAGDVGLVRQQNSQPLNGSNFREDINTSGHIDAGDVGIARQQNSTGLP